MSDLTNSVKSSSLNAGQAHTTRNAKSNTNQSESTSDKLGLSNPALWYSGGFIALFVTLALFDGELLSSLVNTGFAWSVKVFGPYWQMLLLLTFLIGLGLAAGRTGKVILGGIEEPEMDGFRWMAIIFCTLLAGGGVFWAAAEPIAHYVSPPPLYGAQENAQQGAVNALSQSFMHWGFLAWAIVGSLTSIVVMHLHYDKGLPLKPRILLYPVLGERALKGHTGALIDACCIVA
ncbi:MAG: BCCT family transporter, partial [Alteromonas sp.]|nr:BCCT family transporter [Alteromonas sp.]